MGSAADSIAKNEVQNDPGSKTGLSLYAAMLDPSASNVIISKSPVLFSKTVGDNPNQSEELVADKKQMNAALRFQPTRRPVASSLSKPRPRSIVAPHVANTTNVNAKQDRDVRALLGSKSTLEDWTGSFHGEDDDDSQILERGVRRQRGGRKRRKKGKEETAVPQDWDDIYDPLRPNRYEDYKNSEEKDHEIRDWRNKLYSFKTTSKRTSSSNSDSSAIGRRDVKNAFNSKFAPPTDFGGRESRLERSANSTNIRSDETGDEAYARRLRITQTGLQQVDNGEFGSTSSHNVSDHQNSIAQHSDKDNGPGAQSMPPDLQSDVANTTTPGIISRAPVFYPSSRTGLDTSKVPTNSVEDNDQAEAQSEELKDKSNQSIRPGQRNFAERMMAKQGWTKGSGLGLEVSGMTAPLRVQVEKRKKRSDAEGGGWIGPAGKGKIIGGKKKVNDTHSESKGASDDSSIVILSGLFDNAEDVDTNETFLQDLGEKLSDKCGLVERIKLNTENLQAFVKFSTQASAIRAVQIFEGGMLNGRILKAELSDAGKLL